MRRLGQVYAFGGFRLDSTRRVLSCRTSGQAVPLSTPVFDTLQYLVENAGVVVERAALLDAVWPHVTVVENSVSQSISALRRALGDDPAAPRYVSTVPGRGYRFVAEVIAEDAATRNPQAYQLYVAGWSALTRPGGEMLQAALDLLKRAVACDPGFALAQACLADCHAMLCVHGLMPPDEAIPGMRLAVERAMQADPALPEVYVARARLLEIDQQDFAAAIGMLARAIEQDPLCFPAHRYRGLYLINFGKFDDSLAALRRAQALQPLAVYINANIGMALHFAGRNEEAVTQLELTLRLDSEFEVARKFLGRALLQLGQTERAIREIELGPRTLHAHASDLPVAWAMAGRTQEARAALAAILKGPKIQPIDAARIHAVLGEDDAAMTWLERAVAARSFGFFGVDPNFRRLRERPQFLALEKRLGFRA